MNEKLSKTFITIYCCISYIPVLINYLWLIILKEYRSDFTYADLKVTLSPLLISFNFLIFIVVLSVVIISFNKFEERKFVVSSNFYIKISRKKNEVYLILILLLNFYMFFTQGVGKAGGVYNRSVLSTIIIFFNFKFFFWIYFFKYSNKKNNIYYFICLLFVILQFVQGWSHFILSFFLAFLCMQPKRKQRKYLLLVPVLFIAGSLVYYFVHPIKFFIRTGTYVPISMIDAAIHLFERLSNFSCVNASIQNKEKILSLYSLYNDNYTELLSFFYFWIPSFLMPEKSDIVLNNLQMIAADPNYSIYSSAGLGISYFYFLGRINVYNLFYYFSFYFLLLFIYKFMIDLLIPETKPYKYYLLFTMFLYPIQGYSFRMMGADVPAIWTFIVLCFLGVFKSHKHK